MIYLFNKQKWGGVISKKKIDDHSTGIPVHIINSVARCLLPDILKFYESNEGKEYFEQWKAEQKKKTQK